MKDDTISRRAAMLKIAKVNPMRFKSVDDFHDACVDCLKELPSAQQIALTADDIETIRIHLSAFKEELCNQGRWTEAVEYERLIQRLIEKGEQE